MTIELAGCKRLFAKQLWTSSILVMVSEELTSVAWQALEKPTV